MKSLKDVFSVMIVLAIVIIVVFALMYFFIKH
jgi:hypothetical protein